MMHDDGGRSRRTGAICICFPRPDPDPIGAAGILEPREGGRLTAATSCVYVQDLRPLRRTSCVVGLRSGMIRTLPLPPPSPVYRPKDKALTVQNRVKSAFRAVADPSMWS